MTRLFLDTNIVVDVLERREPFCHDAVRLFTMAYNKQVQLVDPHFRMNIITADPDDNKFVDCAFAAGADYLVSEDSHFNVLRTTK